MNPAAPTRPSSLGRPESEEQASGIIWDEGERSWRNEEDAGEEAASERTACDAPVEGLEKGDMKEESTIWVEWEPNDPGNPFNVRSRSLPTCSLLTRFELAVELSSQMDNDLDLMHLHAGCRESSSAVTTGASV